MLESKILTPKSKGEWLPHSCPESPETHRPGQSEHSCCGVLPEMGLGFLKLWKSDIQSNGDIMKFKVPVLDEFTK